MIRLVLGLVLTVEFGYISAQRVAIELCAGCTMVNGAGYNNHTDCDKFIQCRFDADGVLLGQIMHCPFSTYWDGNMLACLPVNEAKCLNDKCAKFATGTQLAADTNCRGYWLCQEGKSTPMCCTDGFKYASNIGCINDTLKDCNDTCFNNKFETPVSCDKYSVVGKPNMYKQNIEGWGWVEMFCAPGTEFVEQDCNCIRLSSTQVQKKACKAEIHLPFTSDHRDESGNGFYVANENVVVNSGVAKFNGLNSRLVIPRFTNLDHNTNVVIKAKYASDHANVTGMAQAIVANSDCGNLPSILLSEDAVNLYFGIGTSDKLFAYTNVPHVQKNPNNPTMEKEVLYKFDNGVLSGSNGVQSESVLAPGYLRNVRCALQIGHADSLQPFKGEIDEITIYLCNL